MRRAPAGSAPRARSSPLRQPASRRRSASPRTGQRCSCHKLPGTSRITAVSAHLLLGNYALPNNWAGPARLTPGQAALLTPPPAEATAVTLEPADRPLFELLSQDGRASHTELAAATGWSESTVRRRLTVLRQSGVLTFLVDIPLGRPRFPCRSPPVGSRAPLPAHRRGLRDS
ncbi:Lrp/AsnC family transcriptional regulator [Streptomyces lasalocidi]